ncbi:MAG TPA: hypothetical protein VFF86_10485 [Candidatus Methylomirabilis sp.]|nr:hypothetical protein [Candidatus Methylomirabilis sp.]
MRTLIALSTAIALAALPVGVGLAKETNQPAPSTIQLADDQGSAPDTQSVEQDQPQTQEERTQPDQPQSEEKAPDSSPSDDDK